LPVQYRKCAAKRARQTELLVPSAQSDAAR